MSLANEIEQEARERAIEKFGPNPTDEQFERVHRCEWDIFTYHCATGDDADCWCGAHVSDLRPAADQAPSQERSDR